jgi:hypothetical protein
VFIMVPILSQSKSSHLISVRFILALSSILCLDC